jgi:Na+/proline symporter
MNVLYIILYLVIQVLIGIYISRFIKSENDFFLGGRRIPTFAIAFSIFATWFGAETCIGSSAAVFGKGLSGSKAEPFGYGLCLVFTAVFVAPRIWNEKYTTMGDFIKDKYGNITEKLFVWVILPSSLIWAAAQLKAFGQVLSATTPVDVFWGTTIATIFVLIYTFLGGFLGDVITDVIQGGILAIGLAALLYYTLNYEGVEISKIPLEKLSFIGENETVLKRIDSWLIPIFGSMVAQELIARVLSAKNPAQARRSTFGGAGLYLFFGSIPVLIGLLGTQVAFSIEESEQFLPRLANTVLPPWMYIIFTGALISAILSTIDSILLAISALISHNFIIPFLKIKKQESKILSARVILIVAGIVAYTMALMGESVYEMVQYSSSFGTTGILALLLGGIVLKRHNGKIAAMTLLLGISLSIFFDFVVKIDASFTLNLIIVTCFYFSFHLIMHKEQNKLID